MTTPAVPLDRIVLGLTGGIAAYKSAELTRLFVKAGVRVDVVMTAAACRFVTPMTLQALSGRPVLTDLWASGADNGMGHIDLSRGADAIVVAPASADFLAKLAHGHADDLLSTLCARARLPVAGRAGDEPADVGATPPPGAMSSGSPPTASRSSARTAATRPAARPAKAGCWSPRRSSPR